MADLDNYTSSAYFRNSVESINELLFITTHTDVFEKIISEVSKSNICLILCSSVMVENVVWLTKTHAVTHVQWSELCSIDEL